MSLDVVFIFGKGSIWQNNELRYSLRSVEKNLKDFNQVFLVGYKPKIIGSKVIEVPHKDIYTNKQRNIMCKIHRACNDERISENFILFNDDYILLDQVSAVNYPYFYDKALQQSINGSHNAYKKCLQETLDVLSRAKKPVIHFDVHFPIIYNKTKFKEMVRHYDWAVPFGYTVKSMYCNHFGIPGELINDCKINYPYRADYIQKNIEGKYPMISLGDKALVPAMKAYLMNKFPDKSKFEI